MGSLIRKAAITNIKPNALYIQEYMYSDYANNVDMVWRKATVCERLATWFEWLWSLIGFVVSFGKRNQCAVHACGWRFWRWYPVWVFCQFGNSAGRIARGKDLTNTASNCPFLNLLTDINGDVAVFVQWCEE